MKLHSLLQNREKLTLLIFLLIIFSFKPNFSQWMQGGSVSGLGSWPSIFVLDISTIFIVGGQNGPIIWRSTNGGANFEQLPANGLPTSTSGRFLTCVWATDVNTIFAGDGSTSGNGLIKNAKVYRTTNGGTNWTTILSTGTNVYGFINGVVFSRTNSALGVANSDPNSTTEKFKTWKTSNGGNNWTLYEADAPNSCGAQNSVFLIDENFFGFGLNTANARVAITTNGGVNYMFSNLAGAGGDNGFVSTVAFSNDKINGLAGTSQTSTTIARTTNGGVNWFSQTIPGTITGHCNIKWVPTTSVVYVVISSSSATQCFKSTDNGNSWNAITFAGATGIAHADLIYNVSNRLLESESYIYATNSSGTVYFMHEIPMPVSLYSFTYSVSGRNVKLNWITSEEINNKGFEIQRKHLNDWEVIGFVNGKGNSGTNTNYQFTDENVPAGKYFYRLKQIDFNGNFEFFNLNGFAEISTPGKLSLLQNFPNPFNSSTKISYEIPENGFVSLKIYDMLGKEIAVLVNENKKAGFYEVLFSNINIPSGTYFCKLSMKNSTAVKRLQFIK